MAETMCENILLLNKIDNAEKFSMRQAKCTNFHICKVVVTNDGG